MLGLEAAREVPCAGGAPKSSHEPKASPKAAAACGGAEVESTRGGRGNYGTYRPITTERTCAGAEVMSTPPSAYISLYLPISPYTSRSCGSGGGGYYGTYRRRGHVHASEQLQVVLCYG